MWYSGYSSIIKGTCRFLICKYSPRNLIIPLVFKVVKFSFKIHICSQYSKSAHHIKWDEFSNIALVWSQFQCLIFLSTGLTLKGLLTTDKKVKHFVSDADCNFTCVDGVVDIRNDRSSDAIHHPDSKGWFRLLCYSEKFRVQLHRFNDITRYPSLISQAIMRKDD